ncbi:uncharacterized protein LOC142550637 isoform X2 [Primulina tabacum]|uniref:uncharacterized protein LOC142550637 isoform X2 n=1 Tax=Primulina tabacum TaxID=48773 RepID=UPI003F5AD4A0
MLIKSRLNPIGQLESDLTEVPQQTPVVGYKFPARDIFTCGRRIQKITKSVLSLSLRKQTLILADCEFSCRQREDDDKWEHDLFEDGGSQVSNRQIGHKDLRLKLQRKNMERATQVIRGSIVGGTRDLREKLSGTLYSRPVEFEPPPLRPKPTTEVIKPTRRSVIAEAAPVSEAKKVASSVPKKKAKQTVQSVDNFLQSLGLEKYSITFQVEEVDMTALTHMSDEDLKVLGIPMGPRKKILLALEAKV